LGELGGIGSPVDNLAAAIGAENCENTEMYPALYAVAMLQGEKGAIRSIHHALEAEKIHEDMYGEVKESVAAGEDIELASVYVCPVCGHTAIGKAPDKCPVCGLSKEKYRQFQSMWNTTTNLEWNE